MAHLHGTMASLYCDKRTGLFSAVFSDKDRRPQRKKISLKTKRRRTAERALAKLEDDYALKQFDPWAPPPEPEEDEEDLTRLGPAVDAYLASCAHLKPKTVTTYDDILRPFTAFLGRRYYVSRISPRRIEAWLETTNTNDVTRRKYVKHLGYLFRFLVRKGVLTEDVSKQVPLRRVPEQAPKAMTADQVAGFVAAVDAHNRLRKTNGRLRDYTWLAFLVEVNVYLGLRRGELIHLRWAQIDFNRRILHVVNSHECTTRSSKERAIPVCTRALEGLRRLQELQSGATG